MDREATVDDVAIAFRDHIAEQKWFPRIADLVPRVEERVLRRREAEIQAAAQEHAIPLPADANGDVDWSKVSTADLPPGYDYAKDPHWQKGLDMLMGRVEEQGPMASGLGVMIRRLDQRRHQFQGASKERVVACPTCKGARYLRGAGPDPVNVKAAEAESRYIKCPTCCPGGQYDAEAERTAIRKSARERVGT